MRLFFLKIMAIIFPIAVLVIAVNFLVDPANIFSSREYISGIAEILSSGHNVDNVSNYNERLLQEQMVRRLDQSPDIVVLGSSRIMEIGSDFFPGKKVLNAGVSHGNINDLVAITGLLDSFHRLPAEILINVDPDLLGEKGSTEWESLTVYHRYFVKHYFNNISAVESALFTQNLQKMYSLVSFEYFKKSIDFLFKGVSKKYFDVGDKMPLISGKLADGTICYSAAYRHPDTLKVATDAYNTGLKTGIPQVDSGKLRLFYTLLDFLDTKKIKTNFILMPYHLSFYTAANKKKDGCFEEYDSLYKQVALKHNIYVLGSFNPQDLSIAPGMFYDMYHCSKEAIKKFLPII